MITQVERLTDNLLPDLLDSTAHVPVDAQSLYVRERKEEGGGGEGIGREGEAAMTISLGGPKSCPWS